MGHDELVIVGRVLLALLLGGLIGMERTLHGRAAGFRTHALVCSASALLMMAAVYQGRWMSAQHQSAPSPSIPPAPRKAS
jgi:putative Mg2+ transporter-C (MgtC) family protein